MHICVAHNAVAAHCCTLVLQSYYFLLSLTHTGGKHTHTHPKLAATGHASLYSLCYATIAIASAIARNCATLKRINLCLCACFIIYILTASIVFANSAAAVHTHIDCVPYQFCGIWRRHAQRCTSTAVERAKQLRFAPFRPSDFDSVVGQSCAHKPNELLLLACLLRLLQLCAEQADTFECTLLSVL